MNCKTPGSIYVLCSKKAQEKVYLGSSCRRPKDRLKEHKDDIEDGKAVAVAEHSTLRTLARTSTLRTLPWRRAARTRARIRWRPLRTRMCRPRRSATFSL
jgi:hypothetical protein